MAVFPQRYGCGNNLSLPGIHAARDGEDALKLTDVLFFTHFFFLWKMGAWELLTLSFSCS